MNKRCFQIGLLIWAFTVPLGFAESFPLRPTVAEMDELVALGTECFHGLNERCWATQYQTNPPAYRVNTPFGRVNPAIGWDLTTDTLGQMAVTSKLLVPWYVNLDTVYPGSTNIDMLTVGGVWGSWDIGDLTSKYTARPADGMNPAVYDNYPLRLYRVALAERWRVLSALDATVPPVNILQRQIGSDYSGNSIWYNTIVAAENSFRNNGGGSAPWGTWDTYSAARWEGASYRLTIIRVVCGGLSIMFSTEVLGNLAAIGFYMSATNYAGGEIGANNSVFDNNGLSGLTDRWRWDQVGVFSGPFSLGEEVLFLDDPNPPARCADPKPNNPPGALRGYVTRSPSGIQRDPIAIGSWWFDYCPFPLW